MHFSEYDTRLAGYALIVDDDDRVLLTWFNGAGRRTPSWSLPGGGIDYDESIEDGIHREVYEETGYTIELESVLLTNSVTGPADHGRVRPYKAIRIVYLARITGGELGTTEVNGTTDRAEWLPLAQLADQPERADIIGLAVEAWQNRNRQP